MINGYMNVDDLSSKRLIGSIIWTPDRPMAHAMQVLAHKDQYCILRSIQNAHTSSPTTLVEYHPHQARILDLGEPPKSGTTHTISLGNLAVDSVSWEQGGGAIVYGRLHAPDASERPMAMSLGRFCLEKMEVRALDWRADCTP